MHLFIRADADSKISTGHIMRCIALAQGWQDRGGTVAFISHCESEALRKRISEEGFQFNVIEKTHPHPDDLAQTLAYLKRLSPLIIHSSPKWLVLDGYHFTSEYQKAIRDSGHRLLVIDDMNHLPYYHADILLNQNINAPGLHYHCNEDAALLLGTRYVLLRREFLKYLDFKHRIQEQAKNILVTLGGSDPDNATLKVIEAIKLLNEADISVKIIIGPANSHLKTLRRILAAAKFKADFLINPPSMPELMVWADMAIAAGGSTCWELAFMGVPIISLILAENQMAVANGITKEGFAVNLGWYESFNTRTASREICSLLQSKKRRLKMVLKGQSLISATGRNHVYERISTLSTYIRLATESDCELIWNWANDPEVRQSAFCTEKFSFEDHKQWFYSKIIDPGCFQFVCYNSSDKPIGQIRFDKICNREYEVDISIDRRFRSKGYGAELIKQALCELKNHTEVDVVHSHVKFGNSASKNVFLKVGFVCEINSFIKNTECFHFRWKQETNKERE